MEARERPPSPQYRPLTRRAWLAQRWIGFTGALALGLLGLNVAYLSAVEKGHRATGIADLVALAYLIQLAVYILGAAVFLAWFYRAYSNARTLGVPFLRHDRGWAIAAWFVPIIALVWPKRMANDAWRASDPDLPANDPDWLKRPVSPLLNAWWAVWIAGGFAGNAWGRVDARTIEHMRADAILGIVAQGTYLAAAVLCILVIRSLTARMEAKAHADVAVLDLSEDERIAAERAARRGSQRVGRRIAWYGSLAIMLLLAVGAATVDDAGGTARDAGEIVGYVLVAIVIGVVVVQVVGRVARRRPALFSGWAALLALVVTVSAASAKFAEHAKSNPSGLSATAPPSYEQPVDDPNCDTKARFVPSPLPGGLHYVTLHGRERRRTLHAMQLPPDLEKVTKLYNVVRRGRIAAFVTAVPNGGEPEAFIRGFVKDTRRHYGSRVRVAPLGISGIEGRLVSTPEFVTAIVNSPCTSVAITAVSTATAKQIADTVVVGA